MLLYIRQFGENSNKMYFANPKYKVIYRCYFIILYAQACNCNNQKSYPGLNLLSNNGNIIKLNSKMNIPPPCNFL